MKSQFRFVIFYVGLFTTFQSTISCSENDLVNYVLNASEKHFQNGVDIWQSPYKNIPSFQSDQSRLHSLWQQEQVDATRDSMNVNIFEVINMTDNVAKLASPSSTIQHACMLSFKKNSVASTFNEDKDIHDDL